MKKLLIIGASGHGKVIADIAIRMNAWENIAFLDDNDDLSESMDIKVIGKVSYAFDNIEDYDFFVAIGNNKTRESIQEKLKAKGANIPVLIHPDSIIGKNVLLGAGTAVMAGAVINCCTSIGKGCIINTGATIDHDNRIDDYVHISPGTNIAGTVHIGNGSWLGIGSTVSNNIYITNNCIIGAGAVVIKDIIETGVYIGIPARRTTRNS